MLNKTDTIDFEPANITEIVQRDDLVVVKFASQPCFTQLKDDVPEYLPYYSCEMLITSGRIEKLDVSLPYDTDSWEIDYKSGSNSCYLPYDFSISEPVRLSFKDRITDEEVIVIIGEGFNLNVIEKVI